MTTLHPHIEGKYEILGKLREGGMGTVFKVRHRLLQETRVVKILNPSLNATQEVNDRFLREARFAIQLRHPNIAQLHDFSVAEDHTAFIVMEFIDGATLAEILAGTGPPPIGLTLEIARQTLKALGFLHRRGFIHRDISPDNLMLARDPDDGGPVCKLIDLGIAKVLKEGTGNLTQTGMFLGKPRYASPEQLGAKGVDARSDLYSFGVVLYELLTGICPIEGNDPSSLMAGHLFRPPIDFTESDPYGRLPQDLREILLRVLAKIPDDRFASAENLAGRLAAVQERFPVHPEDMDEVLSASASPKAPGPSSSGSTQERLDRQFLQAPTPGHVLINERSSDATVVLPIKSPTMAEEKAETGEVTRESPRSPRDAPASAQTTTLSPAPQGADVRPIPPDSRQHHRAPLVGVLILLAMAVVGLGIWKWREPPAPGSSSEKVNLSVSPGKAEDADNGPPAFPSENDSTNLERAPSDTAPSSRSAEPTATVAAVRSTPMEQPASNPDKNRRASQTPAPEKKPSQRMSESGGSGPSQETPQLMMDSPTQAGSAPSAQEDIAARLISLPPPVYPEEAKGTGSYARIVVVAQVDESGAVSAVRVETAYFENGSSVGRTIPSKPSNLLLELYRKAALDAVHKARFEPARKNGKPVPASARVTIEFGKKQPLHRQGRLRPATPGNPLPCGGPHRPWHPTHAIAGQTR